MCGIVGGIGYSVIGIQRALDAMTNRGPDGSGLWREDRVVFGHRRLAILDLTRNGRQPMTDVSGRITITFNGEIYNFRELRKELSSQFNFGTQTDTEVLIAGYLRWGMEGLLRRVRGMFAFGLWDAGIQTLYLARDPFGKKPLYYWQSGTKILFASTMNAILSVLERTPSIDDEALDDYLTYLAVPGEKSIFSGIRKLLPGHYASFCNDQLSLTRYWYLSFASPLDITEEEAIEEVERLLRKGVRRRLVSDVPIGAFLSGGVDSGLVTALMAQESNHPITTLTMGFADHRFDERAFARKVSDVYQTRHHEEVLGEELWRFIPEIVMNTGEPFADSSAIPTYFVAKFAREHVTVALNGDGGDELFAGYTRPLAEAMAIPYRRWFPRVLRDSLGRYVSGKGKLHPRLLNGFKQVLEAGQTSPKEAFVFNRALRPYRQRLYSSAFLHRLGQHHPDDWYHRVWDEADGKTSVDKALYGDTMTYLPDELLPKMDAMTMAHALEARSPLLDVDLAEFVAKLPYTLKIQRLETKALLKKVAERHLPRDVLYRPKKGFNMPMSQWLQTALAKPLRELLLGREAANRGLFQQDKVQAMIQAHQSGKKDYGQQLWSLLMLEIWFQMYVNGNLQVLEHFDSLRHSPVFGGVGL